MPALSNWNTQAERPSPNMRKVSSSSSGMVCMSSSIPRARTIGSVRSINVRVFRPRMSIFTSPQSSRYSCEYWVEIASVRVSR